MIRSTWHLGKKLILVLWDDEREPYLEAVLWE
jgi:hypothetical protein